MTLVSNAFNAIVSLFPLGSSVVIQLCYKIFVALVVVNIVITIVWVINQLKELFRIL